jgi:hypothetical protein
MSKTNKERQEKEERVREDNHKKRKSHSEILNSYSTGEYEEEDFYYEQREKFRSNGRKNRF